MSGNIDAQNHEVFKLVKEYEAQGLDLSGVVIPQFPQMHFELDAPTGDARLYLNGPKVLKTANVNDAIDEVQRLGLDQTLENRLAIDELQVAILKRMPNNHLLPEDKTSLHCAIEQQEGYIQAVKEARSLRSEKREAYAYHKARAQEKFQKQKESEKWARGADPKLLREYDEACDNRRAAKEEMDASEKAFYDLQGVEFTAAPLPPSPQPSAFGRIIDWARKNVSGSGEMTIGKVPLYRTPTPNRSDRNIPPLTSTVSPTKSLPQIT